MSLLIPFAAGKIPEYCVPDLAHTGTTTFTLLPIAALALTAGVILLLATKKKGKEAFTAAAFSIILLATFAPSTPSAHAAEKTCPSGYHYAAHLDKASPAPAPKNPAATTPVKKAPSKPNAEPSPKEPEIVPNPLENLRLVADSNRDGIANVSDNSDVENGKATVRNGAVFLANIDDSAKACPLEENGKALDLEKLKVCNDSIDMIINGEEDAKDLAPLATTPLPKVSDTATGKITLDKASANKVNIFLKQDKKWVHLTPETKISAADLRQGLTLGLEGRDVVKDDSWDGSVTVTLDVNDKDVSKSASATLHAAPLLTHNHTQKLEKVFIISGGGGHYDSKLAKEIADIAKENGVEPVSFDPSQEKWVQDVFEPMYQSMPVPGGIRTMRVLLKSDQVRGVFEDPSFPDGKDTTEKEGTYKALYSLRGPGTAVLNIGQAEKSYTLDSGGNIESLPPLPGYPAGRVIIGKRTAENIPKDADEEEPLLPSKAVRNFFEAQKVQKPIYLDTSFLSVGHIDEFMTTVPANNRLGWKLVVASPKAGLDFVKGLQAKGHGSVPFISQRGGQATTIDLALEGGHAERLNYNAERIIDKNIETLKKEAGIKDDEIVRVPVFYRAELDDDNPNGIDFNGDYYAADFIPNAVNGLVMNNGQFLAPKQWGPIIDGKDVFTEEVEKAFAKAGISLKYADTYRVLYVHGGEVHCGTNALRTPVPYFLKK
ncbi:hypothetical protein KRX54_03725 [Actinomycetaceae bacterium TAE3-ERU4]|nr:hypothetical protein [Actinomycetaceae bacterium TAE3-ERU4]